MSIHTFPKEPRKVASAKFADAALNTIVDGWQYFVSYDRDDDVTKMSHFVIHQDTGESHEVDWTPYRLMTPIDVKRMADLNWPARGAWGLDLHSGYVSAPWNAETAELAWYRWQARVVGMPQHIPPGRADPRFIDLRDGGNLKHRGGALLYGWIAAFAALALIILSAFTFG